MYDANLTTSLGGLATVIAGFNKKDTAFFTDRKNLAIIFMFHPLSGH